MKGISVFDEDPKNYDLWRPRYCPALFEDIISYAGVGEGSVAVEIGCGTGQATEPFLRAGAAVFAVEPGKRLAAFARDKFSHYKNFRVVNTAFEKFEFESESADLVYSATAFHWVDEKTGFQKIREILKPGGVVALFWNRPFVGRGDDRTHIEIQKVYGRYWPSPEREKNSFEEDGRERCERILSSVRDNGFADTKCLIYKAERVFDAEGYVSLLETYSDHRHLPPEIKEEFMEGIRSAINGCGGRLRVYDTMDLYLGRRP